MAELTYEKFSEYLRVNAGREYHLPRGTVFTYSIRDSRNAEFPYSVQFHSADWSPKTIRMSSGNRIEEFLAIFNRNPSGGLDQYKNRGGKGTPAWVATYLLPLMQEARRID